PMTDSLHASFPVHQEEDVIASRRLVRIGVVSLLVGALGAFFAGLILVVNTGTLRPSAAGPHGTQPAPREISRVEQTPIWYVRDGIDLRDAQKRELETWGWLDRDAGLAEIPIERAIDLVLRTPARVTP
ncbi:MAG: hypothetical protein ACREJ3_16335, partial [Polyangiaceae bacterium]